MELIRLLGMAWLLERRRWRCEEVAWISHGMSWRLVLLLYLRCLIPKFVAFRFRTKVINLSIHLDKSLKSFFLAVR